MTTALAAWLHTHTHTRRAWLLIQALWATWITALMTAPHAAASAAADELSWTGLKDSYGVPIGAHVVATVPMLEALDKQGTPFGVDPAQWGPALADRMVTALGLTGLGGVLAFESAALAFLCAVGIWLVRFALSTTWLGWLAAAARPILVNVNAVEAQFHLVAGVGLVCAVVGAVVGVMRGVGRGLGIMAGGVLVFAASLFLLRDPLGEETGDNGVLGIGRSLGFRISQGFGNNGPLTSGGMDAQLDRLSSSLVDVLVRQQVEQVNFGHVIDSVPGAAAAYNAALMSPDPTVNAAHAVGVYDPSALAHAQQLTEGSAALFALLICVVGVVLLAVCYVGAEVVRIGFKAFFYVLIIGPAALLAIPPGPPRQFAKRAAFRLVVFGLETLVATVGLGVLVILLSDTARGTLPGVNGMAAPMAKLLVMAMIGVGGAFGFRYLLKSLFGDRGIAGPVRAFRAVSGGSAAAERTIQEAGHIRRRAQAGASWLSLATSRSAGPPPPARQAHPTPAPARTQSQTASPPTGQTTSQPGPASPAQPAGPAPANGRTPAPPRTAAAAGTAATIAAAALPAAGAAKVAAGAARIATTSAATQARSLAAQPPAAPQANPPRTTTPPSRTQPQPSAPTQPADKAATPTRPPKAATPARPGPKQPPPATPREHPNDPPPPARTPGKPPGQ